MGSERKLAIVEPGSKEDKGYFSLRLKRELWNESSEYEAPARLLAVSGLEGDFHALRSILLKNGVINKYYKWTFEDGHLVVLGDCLTQGKYTPECLWLIYALEERARRRGGYVHYVLGDGEIRNMNGAWSFFHPKYATNTKSASTHYMVLYDGNNELWRWLLTKNIIEKVGDILFVHSTVVHELNESPLSVSAINNLVRPHYRHFGETFAEPLFHSIFTGVDSKSQCRDGRLSAVDKEQIDLALEKFGVSVIVTGSSVDAEVISGYNGKVFNVGRSRTAEEFKGLLIEDGSFYKVSTKGDVEKIE